MAAGRSRQKTFGRTRALSPDRAISSGAGSRDYLIRVFARIELPYPSPFPLRLVVSSVVLHNSGLRLPPAN